MSPTRIAGDSIAVIFPTVKWEALPVFHLSGVELKVAKYETTACGIAYQWAGLAVLPLRHAIRFARLCLRCQTAAGILIIEPPEDPDAYSIHYPDETTTPIN